MYQTCETFTGIFATYFSCLKHQSELKHIESVVPLATRGQYQLGTSFFSTHSGIVHKLFTFWISSTVG